MAREDLNPVEEARACAALVEELGLTREDVGRRVGRSRVAVSNLIRLLDLPDEALELLERGELSEGHGRALLLAEDHADRRRARSRRRRRRLVGPRARAPRPRRRRRGDARPKRARRTPGAAPRPGRPRSSRSPTRFSAALGPRSTVAPARAAGYRVELGFDDRSTRRCELARRAAAARGPQTVTLAARIAASRAISSVG